MNLLTGCLNILLFNDWSSLCHLLSVSLLSCSSDVPISKYTVTWKYNILNYYKYNIINMVSIDHKFVFIFLTVFSFLFPFCFVVWDRVLLCSPGWDFQRPRLSLPSVSVSGAYLIYFWYSLIHLFLKFNIRCLLSDIISNAQILPVTYKT